ncbi:MAG TPA: hypothetical protein VGM03_21055 [Phycisphaerae bacterium]
MAAIRDIERTSAFENLDRGEAEIVRPRDYPEPMKRFLARASDASYQAVSTHEAQGRRLERPRRHLAREAGGEVDRRAQPARARVNVTHDYLRAMLTVTASALMAGCTRYHVSITTNFRERRASRLRAPPRA